MSKAVNDRTSTQPPQSTAERADTSPRLSEQTPGPPGYATSASLYHFPPAEMPDYARLPPLDHDLWAIHFSCGLGSPWGAATPEIFAIGLRHVLTRENKLFSTLWLAEERRPGHAPLPEHLAECEGQMLLHFYQFMACHPHALWLNWGMNKPQFGFDLLAQRARIRHIVPVEIPQVRRYNLVTYLKHRFGEKFVPDPHFPEAIKLNGLGRPDLLDSVQAAAAWQRRDYAALLDSLTAKVACIGDLFVRTQTGTLRVATVSQTGAEKPAEATPQRQTDGTFTMAPKATADLSGDRVSEPAGGLPPVPPLNYLCSWAEISHALNRRNNEQQRRLLRDLNHRFDGPIIMPPAGGQPKVVQQKLLHWWNSLEERWREDARRGDTQATVAEQYQHGRTETVVPEIAGHVKKRRGRKPETPSGPGQT